MHVQFSGRYRLQVFHGDTDILLKDTGWFDNLITDNGLNLIGTGFSPVTCLVGSDTAAPNTSDTSIANVLASTTMGSATYGVNYTVLPYYGWNQIAFTFAIGAIQGTIGQVAVGSSASNLLSKAQLMNVSGTPTTLTLGGIDRLTLTYEFRQCINTEDVTGSLDINGTTYSYVGRPSDIDGNFWRVYLGVGVGALYGLQGGKSFLYRDSTALGTVFTSPNGTSGLEASSSSTAAYVPGSYRSNISDTWSTAKGDLQNIKAFKVFRNWGSYALNFSPNNGGTWQFLLDAGVNKTQYQDFTLEWAYSWGRCA